MYLRNGVDNQQEKLESAERELERTRSLLNTQRQLSRGASRTRESFEDLEEAKINFE